MESAEVRLYFADEADAEDAARDVRTAGLTASIERAAFGSGWAVVVAGEPSAVLEFGAQ